MIPSGYALLAGLSNTGKSSLLNALCSSMLSPVAAQPGSTRMPVTGICTPGNAQICFVDTPPLESGFDPSDINWVDAVVLLMDIITFEADLEHPSVKGFLEAFTDRPVVLALGRSDWIMARHTEAYLNKALYTNRFADCVAVSPPGRQGVARLQSAVLRNIPVRNRLFPRNVNTLNSRRFLISEQIRTQLFSILPPETASETAVQVEELSVRDGKLYVRANLIVSRASQKGIVIGRKGHTLGMINDLSSKAINVFTGELSRLDMWVRVREGWPENTTDMLEFGYVC